MGRNLQPAFAAILDRRGAHGRRHSLPAILSLAVVAMISGARSLYAIHQWGRCQDADTVRACADPMTSHTHPKTPAVSGLHRVFSALDVDAFESAIAQWAQQVLAASGPAPAAIAVAGKALQGLHGTELPGVRLVTGSAPGCGLVAGQKRGQSGAE